MATDVRAIVFADADDHDLTKLAEYEAVGGYQALAKARTMAPQAVVDELQASELRGRGGAFFPTGRKWAFIPKPDQNPNPHYLVVNADESEPGSFKDNEIMSRVPHRFLEGCLITAHAVDCTAAPARTSAARSRGCSSRSRGSAGSRAHARRFPRSRGCTRRRR